MRGYVEGTMLPEDAVLSADTADAAAANGTCLHAIRTIALRDGEPPVTKGGNQYVLFKTELRLPLADKLALGFFVDAGNLWVQAPKTTGALFDLRLGTGASLRYNTPVGALAVDLGINPAPRTYAAQTPQDGNTTRFREATWQLHLSVGAF